MRGKEGKRGGSWSEREGGRGSEREGGRGSEREGGRRSEREGGRKKRVCVECRIGLVMEEPFN